MPNPSFRTGAKRPRIPVNSDVRKRMNIAYLADHKEVIPTLAQWFYQEWAYLHPDRTLEDVHQLLVERANKEKIPVALVAFEGNELLGTVCLKVHDMDTRLDLTPWLAGLYVATSKRRQGIGAILVSAIEKKAREFGVQTLYLYTPESEYFYARLGWDVKERTEYHGCPVSIMEKQIIF
jgi:predicted N-acetyltransferase YhbS